MITQKREYIKIATIRRINEVITYYSFTVVSTYIYNFQWYQYIKLWKSLGIRQSINLIMIIRGLANNLFARVHSLPWVKTNVSATSTTWISIQDRCCGVSSVFIYYHFPSWFLSTDFKWKNEEPSGAHLVICTLYSVQEPWLKSLIPTCRWKASQLVKQSCRCLCHFPSQSPYSSQLLSVSIQ